MKDWLFIRISAYGGLEFVMERSEAELAFVRGWNIVLDLPRLIVATASIGGWAPKRSETVILIHKDLVHSYELYRSPAYSGIRA